tara:strand:- start:195 stop:332 length:138 start_codon:yes stop_codon:yes gene_type:complete
MSDYIFMALGILWLFGPLIYMSIIELNNKQVEKEIEFNKILEGLI